MECYACANPATRQCRRCARVYCEMHGGDLCAECLSPASSLPSFNLYRGSLLALLVGTAVALWLLIRPPGPSGGDEVVFADITPTEAATLVAATPTPLGPTTPAVTGTPATPTPAASPTPTAGPPGPTPTPQPVVYEVVEGDTLLTIAEANTPPGVAPVDYANQIAAANGISIDTPITPGQTLILP